MSGVNFPSSKEEYAQNELSGRPVIQTRGLRKIYKGVEALKSLDLSIPEHSIFGFLGPNGAGKSTTIKLLLGLIKPTSGSGTILGYDMVRDSIAIRKRVGYLAQDPRFYDYMTAREVLRFTAQFFYTGPKKAIEDRIAEVIDLVGLTDRADRPTKGFSGGERQRLGIAQAQINHPDLLILDEPAAALDPLGRRDVLEVMQRLRTQTTIFYSTHLLDDVQRVSDMVAILKNGEMVVQAPINVLLAGNKGTSYELRLRGNVQPAYNRIKHQPWVSSINVVSTDDPVLWQVTVNDKQMAEEQLLSLILSDGQVTVLAFDRTKQALEDVFINLIEGDQHEPK